MGNSRGFTTRIAGNATVKEMPERIHKWAVFVKHAKGSLHRGLWTMEANNESASFSNAAKDAGDNFREQRQLHPDRRIMVVKVFDTYEPNS